MRNKYFDLAAKTSFVWIAFLIILIEILFGLNLVWTLPKAARRNYFTFDGTRV